MKKKKITPRMKIVTAGNKAIHREMQKKDRAKAGDVSNPSALHNFLHSGLPVTSANRKPYSCALDDQLSCRAGEIYIYVDPGITKKAFWTLKALQIFKCST